VSILFLLGGNGFAMVTWRLPDWSRSGRPVPFAFA